MPSPWPSYMTRGPPEKASFLLDMTCFSTTDFDNFDDFQSVSQDHLLSLLSEPPIMQNSEVAELLRKKVLSNGMLDVRVRYNHPTFPSPTFLTTLIQ